MDGTETTSGASQFASTAVILRVLAAQIRNPQHLLNLCLTSKLFYAETIPFLYREIDCPVERLDRTNPHLVHARTFIPTTLNVNADDDFEYSHTVQQLLTKMPLLETFVWRGEEWDLTPSTIDVLSQSCRRLKGIHLYYDHSRDVWESIREEWRQGIPVELIPDLWGWHDLSPFRGLRSLTLKQLDDDLLRWRQHIAGVLVHSPDLRALDISLSAFAINNAFRHNEPHRYTGFFDRLCNHYAAAGGKPLHLSCLRCGHAIYPTSQASLAKLTDLAYLEEVYICNEEVRWEGRVIISLYTHHNHFRSGIAFNAFLPQNCPNLRHFYVHQYALDVYEFLCEVAKDESFSRKLSVFPGKSGYLPEAFYLLPLPHTGLPLKWRVLVLEMDLVSRDRFAWNYPHNKSIEGALDHLATSGGDSLEGLMLELPGAYWKPGMHLPDSPYLPPRFYKLDALEAAVRRLPRLNQLVVNHVCPRLDSDREDASKEMASDAAYTLALASKSLVYVNVGQRFWRVNRQQDGSVQLEELGRREWMDVELFYHASWKSHRRLYMESDRMYWPNFYRSIA